MQRKVPLPGRILARCILRRRFAGHFGCMARISCQSQPAFGCMACESCRELAIFPSEAAFGMHGAQNLPRIDARERTARVYCHCQSGQERIRAQSCHRRAPGERISRAFCHRRAPRNAPRENIATTSRPKTHSRKSCHGRTPGFAPHQITAALPAKKTAPKAGLGERPRQKHEIQSAGAAGASSGYGAVQRHRRTLGNAARRNIAMADNAPRQKKASILLAFFCCFVYGSSGHRGLRGRKPPAFGSLLD